MPLSPVRSSADPTVADAEGAADGSRVHRVRPSVAALGFPLTMASSMLGPTSMAANREPVGGRVGFPPGYGRTIKRAMDVVIAGSMLVLLSPVLLMVAVLVRSRMGGDILFSQPRVGRDGKTFACHKFRTMVDNGQAILDAHFARFPDAKREWDETRKLKDDPRVTPLGRILRKSSLDELPQLYNVLTGDMSCVGPRPIVPVELEKYGANKADYLSVRPGLTGAWQISGRSQLSYAERVRLDADYVRNWSLKRDIVILLKTIPAVAKFEEAA